MWILRRTHARASPTTDRAAPCGVFELSRRSGADGRLGPLAAPRVLRPASAASWSTGVGHRPADGTPAPGDVRRPRGAAARSTYGGNRGTRRATVAEARTRARSDSPRPTLPLDLAQPARLEVEHGVHDLGLRVHHERAVARDRLAQRLAREQQQPRAARASAGTASRTRVARPEDAELAVARASPSLADVRRCPRTRRRTRCGRPASGCSTRRRAGASSPGTTIGVRVSITACTPSASPAITRTCAQPVGRRRLAGSAPPAPPGSAAPSSCRAPAGSPRAGSRACGRPRSRMCARRHLGVHDAAARRHPLHVARRRSRRGCPRSPRARTRPPACRSPSRTRGADDRARPRPRPGRSSAGPISSSSRNGSTRASAAASGTAGARRTRRPRAGWCAVITRSTLRVIVLFLCRELPASCAVRVSVFRRAPDDARRRAAPSRRRARPRAPSGPTGRPTSRCPARGRPRTRPDP